MVELESALDRRIVSISWRSALLRFAAEPSSVHRKTAYADLSARFVRVLATCTVDERVDPSTRPSSEARLKDAVAAAAALGDRDDAIVLLEQLGKVSSGIASWPS